MHFSRAHFRERNCLWQVRSTIFRLLRSRHMYNFARGVVENKPLVLHALSGPKQEKSCPLGQWKLKLMFAAPSMCERDVGWQAWTSNNGTEHWMLTRKQQVFTTKCVPVLKPKVICVCPKGFCSRLASPMAIPTTTFHFFHPSMEFRRLLYKRCHTQGAEFGNCNFSSTATATLKIPSVCTIFVSKKIAWRRSLRIFWPSPSARWSVATIHRQVRSNARKSIYLVDQR